MHVLCVRLGEQLRRFSLRCTWRAHRAPADCALLHEAAGLRGREARREDTEMRFVLLALGIAVCVAFHHAWLAHAAEAALSEEARLATELRCKGREGHAASDCRRLLEKLYLAGTLDPERTLRAHCTPVRMIEWGARPPAPPALCVQRYGGWQKS